ncbi:MAG TPA: hypothetical protein VFR31_10050 [Thermoanaerobaculia bacterium]|nr:hypothetical protein [Thermoanaerobaculia bacterium]
MTGCDRFEKEGLLALEQGQPLDEHFATCPDCLAAREAYERLEEQISRVGEEDEPAPDWQARVWERIEQRQKRTWSFWWLAPIAVAAMALFLVWLPGRSAPGLQVEIEHGASVRRGIEARPGDVLRLSATTGGARHAEVRVYRNDTELVLRCEADSSCSVALDGMGKYQPLLLHSENPIPAPTSDLERDTAAALDAGAEIEMGEEIDVR